MANLVGSHNFKFAVLQIFYICLVVHIVTIQLVMVGYLWHFNPRSGRLDTTNIWGNILFVFMYVVKYAEWFYCALCAKWTVEIFYFRFSLFVLRAMGNIKYFSPPFCQTSVCLSGELWGDWPSLSDCPPWLKLPLVLHTVVNLVLSIVNWKVQQGKGSENPNVAASAI